MILAMLAVTGCNNAPPRNARATVTVKLPPARPYIPAPAFSFGSAPRQQG
jgi:hypothetical protein